MKHSQVTFGAAFSYILIALNAIYNLVVTPFVIGCLGSEEFGVYQAMASLTTSLMVFDLGMGGTVMRYISKFIEEKRDKEISNYICMTFIQAFVIIVILLGVSFVLYAKIDVIFSSGMNDSNLTTCRNLFKIQIIILVSHILENILNGVITGYNHFIFGNGIKTVRLICRAVLVFVFIKKYPNAEALVYIDLLVIILMILLELLYIKKTLRVKFIYYRWDSNLFKESFSYTIWLFITSLIMQVNGNAANIIIGAIRGPVLVAVYSMALLVNNMFGQLSTSISGVLLPTAMNKIITSRDESEERDRMQEFIVKIGRIQFAILGTFVCCFVSYGKDFINLWLGNDFSDVYFLSIILMTPLLFELCVNVCVTILRAKNKLAFRTLALGIGSIFTIGLSIVGVKIYNYYAVAIVTSLSTLIFSVVVMNIYYHRSFHYNMWKIYLAIFKGILPALLIILGVNYIINMMIGMSWGLFAIKCALGIISSVLVLYNTSLKI